MKPFCLVFALICPLAAHPSSDTSVHGDLDLQAAESAPPASPKISIREEGERRIIESNGIPDHPTGRFPGRGNPHPISSQSYQFSMPLKPTPAPEPIPLVRQPFGIAVNGVLFDPGTAEYYQNERHSDWNYEALSGKINLGLDEHHAHVQPSGAYHYHGLPKGLFDELSEGRARMTLIGWAADGFPIYGLYGHKVADDPKSPIIPLESSYRLKKEARPDGSGNPGGSPDGSFTADFEFIDGLGDLDKCNGRQGVTPEFPDGTYYYVLTADHPFIPRFFKGVPDPSFQRRGPEGRGPGGSARPGGRPERRQPRGRRTPGAPPAPNAR